MRFGSSIIYVAALLGVSTMAACQQTQMFKFTAHHFKRDDVSEDAFNKWYTEEQIPRMISIIQRHGIVNFNLLLSPPSLRAVFQKDIDTLKGDLPGWKMAPYDVSSSYWVHDPQQIRDLLTDPDWNGKVVAFEENWVDTSRADVQIGFETVYLENGKIVNTPIKEYD